MVVGVWQGGSELHVCINNIRTLPCGPKRITCRELDWFSVEIGLYGSHFSRSN